MLICHNSLKYHTLCYHGNRSIQKANKFQIYYVLIITLRICNKDIKRILTLGHIFFAVKYVLLKQICKFPKHWLLGCMATTSMSFMNSKQLKMNHLRQHLTTCLYMFCTIYGWIKIISWIAKICVVFNIFQKYQIFAIHEIIIIKP